MDRWRAAGARRRTAPPRRPPRRAALAAGGGASGGREPCGGVPPRAARPRGRARSRSCSGPFESLAQPGQAAADALADDRLRRLGAARDVGVLVLVEHAGEHRLALVGRQRGRPSRRIAALASATASASTRSSPSSVSVIGPMPSRRRARSSTAPFWAAWESWRRAMPYSHAAAGPGPGGDDARRRARRRTSRRSGRRRAPRRACGARSTRAARRRGGGRRPRTPRARPAWPRAARRRCARPSLCS